MKIDEAIELVENMVIAKDCEIVKTLDLQATICRGLEELKEYHTIGTIEECKDAVENIEKFYQFGYNKAIDDMEKAILDKLPVVKKDEKVSLIGCVADVMCIVSNAVEKLKEGKNK